MSQVVNTSIGLVEKEIEDFQKEKQAALSEIEVMVILKMHQIEFLDDEGNLRTDMENALVFSKSALGKLYHRIGELAVEKTTLKQKHKELKKDHIDLSREKKEKENKVAELEARALEVQMLKFGQVKGFFFSRSFSQCKLCCQIDECRILDHRHF